MVWPWIITVSPIFSSVQLTLASAAKPHWWCVGDRRGVIFGACDAAGLWHAYYGQDLVPAVVVVTPPQLLRHKG